MLHLQGIHSSDAADVIRSTSETLVWGTSLLAHTSTSRGSAGFAPLSDLRSLALNTRVSADAPPGASTMTAHVNQHLSES